MTEYQELLRDWKANQPIRAEWYQILESKAFKAAAALIEARMVEEAEGFTEGMPDTLLSRRLSEQRGARRALKHLKHLCDPEPTPPDVEVPYSHIDAKYLEQRRNNQPNE